MDIQIGKKVLGPKQEGKKYVRGFHRHQKSEMHKVAVTLCIITPTDPVWDIIETATTTMATTKI